MPKCRRMCVASARKQDTDMPRMTMIEAVRSAMDVSMGRDDNVVVFDFLRDDVDFLAFIFPEKNLAGDSRGDAGLTARQPDPLIFRPRWTLPAPQQLFQAFFGFAALA